jgi:hypothetical protein
VTLAVQSHHLQRSALSDVASLYAAAPSLTLTVWNSSFAPVAPDLFGWLRKNLDPHRTFFDLVDAHGQRYSSTLLV